MVRFCVCYINFNVVFLLCRMSSLIFDVFPSVLVCNPDLFFLNRFMNVKQRYTTVAFILITEMWYVPIRQLSIKGQIKWMKTIEGKRTDFDMDLHYL